jgi:biotin-[acetyl-CoA-carboxylase] ligase BirA-like protein
MILITDNPKFADRYFSTKPAWQSVFLSSLSDDIMPVAERLLKNETVYTARFSSRLLWQYMFFVEFAFESQFDVLTEHCRNNIPIPRNTLCIAGSGRGFHGLRDRQWVSEQGNIHISAYFQPSLEIKNFVSAFHVLPAVSVVQAIDKLNNFSQTASVKWINDILMGSSKVGGVLAYSQTRGNIVTDVVLGIGLNVEKKPIVEATPFVPEAGCLADYAIIPRDCTRNVVFEELLNSIDINYKKVTQGGFNELLEFYSNRSAIIGRDVKIMTDNPESPATEITSGVVESIGENLELYLKGANDPIWNGRLIIEQK